jgi:ferredoxin
METILIDDGVAAIDLARCIGGGLCVTSCPVDAIEPVKKPEDELYHTPKTGAETYMRMMPARGDFSSSWSRHAGLMAHRFEKVQGSGFF